jgi:Ca-activated chloride channel family protein
LRRRARFAAWAAGPLLAVAAAGAAARFEVGIVEPPAGAPAFGRVRVVAEVRGAPAVAVELEVDGESAGRLEGPPWIFEVDLGDVNRPHALRVVAFGAGGERDDAVLETPAVRVDEVVELPLVQLYVTAAGADGARAPDLPRPAFAVRDDGVRQRLVTFERGDVPLTAALLLDSSLSMRGAPLEAALAGARSFVAGMAPLDEASVLLVADRILARTPYAGAGPELVAGLSAVVAQGGTAINDHLFLALTELEQRQGRRVVVLLSDGVDFDSYLSARELAPLLGRSGALFYWIRSGRSGKFRQRSVWRDADEHAAEIRALENLVASSGGRVLDLPDPAGAEALFREILDELRGQYVLGYYPHPRRHDGAWREVEVDVARPGVRLRSRAGYYDD